MNKMKKKSASAKSRQSPRESGLRHLLSTSQQSHFNAFIGHSRIPHKYDHFHEKTYVSRDALKSRGSSHPPYQLNYNNLEEFLNCIKPANNKQFNRALRTPLPRILDRFYK